jgi:hypothetical protein
MQNFQKYLTRLRAIGCLSEFSFLFVPLVTISVAAQATGLLFDDTKVSANYPQVKGSPTWLLEAVVVRADDTQRHPLAVFIDGMLGFLLLWNECVLAWFVNGLIPTLPTVIYGKFGVINGSNCGGCRHTRGWGVATGNGTLSYRLPSL